MFNTLSQKGKQIKTTVRCSSAQSEWQSSRKLNNTGWKERREKEPSYSVGGNTN
jgi:hypothetical protein